MRLRRIKTRKTAFWPTLSLAHGDESHKNAENILIKRRKKGFNLPKQFFFVLPYVKLTFNMHMHVAVLFLVLLNVLVNFMDSF